MSNLELWEKVRAVPSNAQKEIGGGRLKGMTDINPLWRIKKLTEQFGMCGIGWKYELVNKHILEGGNEEKSAFVDILLYVKVDDKWSEGIPGTGGSSFVAKESKGLYTSDECFKMALTDALSVSCKALGMGADIYWNKDKTKYDKKPETTETKKTDPPKDDYTIEQIGSLKFKTGKNKDKTYLEVAREKPSDIKALAEWEKTSVRKREALYKLLSFVANDETKEPEFMKTDDGKDDLPF